MGGAMHKTMVYLGLKDEGERYDDEYYADAQGYDDAYAEPQEAVEEPQEASVTPLRGGSNVRLVQNRDLGAIRRITTIHPRTYNEAKTVGENFRDGIPVIMNLTDMSDADAKRLVDFAAGLVFGLRGSIERVTSKVFLLSPETVEVNAEEGPIAASGRGVFNQS